MGGVFSQTRAEFLQFQLRIAAFSLDGVIVVAGFFADQLDAFRDFLAFGHGKLPLLPPQAACPFRRANNLRLCPETTCG